MRTSLFTTLGILAIAATSFAGPVKARGAWATGHLDHFDAAARSVVIKQGGHQMTFTLAQDARVMQGKKALEVGDLSGDIGRQVKVRYTGTGSAKVAEQIVVSEGASAHAATPVAKK